MTLILYIGLLMLPVIKAASLDGLAMFEMNQEMNKLISTNQIGYYFKKVVKRNYSKTFYIQKDRAINTAPYIIYAKRDYKKNIAKT